MTMAIDHGQSAAKLYNNSALSDVKIKQVNSGEVCEYYAHNAILSLASTYFLKMFTGPFMEADHATIETHDDDPALFEILLRYVYHGRYNYQAIERLASDNIDRVWALFDLSSIADKYNISDLDNSAFHDMIQRLEKLADPDFAIIRSVIERHYSSVAATDQYKGRELTLVAIEPRRKFVESPVFDAVIESHPGSAVDIARAAKDAYELCTENMYCSKCDRNMLIGRNVQASILRSFYCIFCGCSVARRYPPGQ